MLVEVGAVPDGVLAHHLGPEDGAPGEDAKEGPELAAGAVQHGGNVELPLRRDRDCGGGWGTGPPPSRGRRHRGRSRLGLGAHARGPSDRKRTGGLGGGGGEKGQFPADAGHAGEGGKDDDG